MSNPSWQRRYRAHLELLRRADGVPVEAADRLAYVKATDPAIHHLPWLTATGRTPQAARALTALAEHSLASARLQAVRALAQFPHLEAPRDIFLRALGDVDARVRLAGVLSFFNPKRPLDEKRLQGAARSKDTYLRQAATLLLAERASFEFLTELCQAGDAKTRLAGVLAAGFRLTLPPATESLPEYLPLDPYPESANVVQYADAKIDLRSFGRVGNFTIAEHWKAGKHTDAQERLFALLVKRLEDSDEQVRLQAAHFLSLLNDTRSEPRVAKVIIDSEEHRLAGAPVTILKRIDKAWVAGPFSDGKAGLETRHAPEQGPIDLAARYRTEGGERTWTRTGAGGYIDFRKRVGPCDHSSFYVYWRFESATACSLMLFVGSNDGVEVWHNGRSVWKNRIVRRALSYDDMVMLRVQPGGNEILVRVQNVTGDCGLYINYKTLGDVVPSLPEKLDFQTLAERLEAAGTAGGQAAIPPALLRTDWEATVAKGNPEQGRKLFSTEGLGCAGCHTITANQAGGVGPSLAEAGKRFTIPQLVQSILLPSRQVSPVFRASLIEMQGGEVLFGMVVSETAEKLELIASDTKRATLLKRDIVGRKLQDLSPMPQGIVQTADELRDLLAYLLSSPPEAQGG